MKLFTLILALISFSAFNTVNADLYLETAVESGGDELIGTDTDEEISAGGGVKFAIGIQNPVNADETASIRLSLGKLIDYIDATNGEAEFDAYTFDALYLIHSGPHSIGIGGTMHMNPEYSDTVDGFRPLKVQFDDAYGVMFQYAYQFRFGLGLGLRLTNIDYEDGVNTIDASSLGAVVSWNF